jgi:hypothetical protein
MLIPCGRSAHGRPVRDSLQLNSLVVQPGAREFSRGFRAIGGVAAPQLQTPRLIEKSGRPIHVPYDGV